MLEDVKKAVFSWNGTATAIAVLGFLSSIVTNFVDTNATISVRWLVFLATISLYAIIILLKVAHDALERGRPSPPFENPIQYVQESAILVIRKNEHFVHDIVVGCYHQKDGLDRLAYIGVVSLVQSKIIQIRIEHDLGILESIPWNAEDLKMIEIRPVVPFREMERLFIQGGVS
ncbi:hypothetical protein NRB15_24975 [Pseudomonas alliivorans]|uniref:hypothetical protein n=1 Tax=Pseudomonas alliivorans TaxID=2810613 RepID=UPI00211CA48E|nr:hypothetical protein [Pseudomonas alliivorans]MCQ9473597.1 hypothetical protein [Pseudomonas alliivorans]MEE4998106.1 hypothetical protein [Pseudomonas alliivorans]